MTSYMGTPERKLNPRYARGPQ